MTGPARYLSCLQAYENPSEMSVLRFASAEVGAHHDIEGEDFHTSFVGPAPAGQSRGHPQYEVGNVDDPEKGLFFTLYVNVPRDERHQLYIVKVYSAIFLAAFRRLLDEESGAASYSGGPLIRKFPKFPEFPGGRQALPRPPPSGTNEVHLCLRGFANRRCRHHGVPIIQRGHQAQHALEAGCLQAPS